MFWVGEKSFDLRASAFVFARAEAIGSAKSVHVIDNHAIVCEPCEWSLPVVRVIDRKWLHLAWPLGRPIEFSVRDGRGRKGARFWRVKEGELFRLGFREDGYNSGDNQKRNVANDRDRIVHVG
jgi:hypothetical protein